MNPEEIIRKAKRVIEEEARELSKLSERLDHSFVRAVELILNCEGKVITTGVGKSGHIAQKVASTLSSTGTPSHYLHPSEALHGDLGVVESKDVVLAFSKSGESAEVVALLPYIKLLGTKLISVTNNPNSTLAKHSDVHIFLGVSKEACPLNLAPTTSTTLRPGFGGRLGYGAFRTQRFYRKGLCPQTSRGCIG
jgi:arabinose-5-phosphate isomerase